MYPLIWPEINTADNHALNLSEDAKADGYYFSPCGDPEGAVDGEENEGMKMLRHIGGGHEQAVMQAASTYRRRVLSFAKDTNEDTGASRSRTATQDSTGLNLEDGYAAYRTRVLSFATDPELAQEEFSDATFVPVDRGFDIAITGTSSRYLVTLVLVSIASILAQAVPGVSTVWAIVGSSLGIAIAFLLPAYSYVRVWNSLGNGRKMDSHVLAAYAMVMMSAVLIVVCTGQTLVKLI
jgi:hypothetical protein